MPTPHVEHQIGDFDTGEAAVDRDPIGRRRSGVRRLRVARPLDDAPSVVIDPDVDAAGGVGVRAG
jgi:hypothetical protein